jgi:hypothetical protein
VPPATSALLVRSKCRMAKHHGNSPACTYLALENDTSRFNIALKKFVPISDGAESRSYIRWPYHRARHTAPIFIATNLQTAVIYRNPITVSTNNSSTTSTSRHVEDRYQAVRVAVWSCAGNSFHAAMMALEGGEKVLTATVYKRRREVQQRWRTYRDGKGEAQRRQRTCRDGKGEA